MKINITTRLTGFVSVIALLSGLSFNAAAQQYGYVPAPGQAPVPVQAPVQVPPQSISRQAAPVMPAPRTTYGYPYRSQPAPYYGNGNRYPTNRYPGNRYPGNQYQGNQYQGNRPPYYANRYNRPYGGNNRSFGPWGGGPLDMKGNAIPWSRKFWDDIGRGGKNPFDDIDEWMDFNEPREGMANMWDDMLNAPHDSGQMPGGFTAPSISVPNPIDVQREFENASKDMPDIMRENMDNSNFNFNP